MSDPLPTEGKHAQNPINHDQEMAAFLDSMLLSAPIAYSENVEESKQNTPNEKTGQSPPDVQEKPQQKTDSTPARPSDYEQLSLMFGLVNDASDGPKSPSERDAALFNIFTKVRTNEVTYMDLQAVSFAVATAGNLTEDSARQVPSKMMDGVIKAMEKLGLKFAEHDTKRDSPELDLAGFAALFSADMFSILKSLKAPSCLQQLLPPEVSTQIPPELTFLQVGALSCVLSKPADKRKLQQVVKYLIDQFCKRVAKMTGHDEENIHLDVLRSQVTCSEGLEFAIKSALDERDLVDALSRVKLPGKSTASSKKRMNGKKMVKVKSSKPK